MVKEVEFNLVYAHLLALDVPAGHAAIAAALSTRSQHSVGGTMTMIDARRSHINQALGETDSPYRAVAAAATIGSSLDPNAVLDAWIQNSPLGAEQAGQAMVGAAIEQGSDLGARRFEKARKDLQRVVDEEFSPTEKPAEGTLRWVSAVLALSMSRPEKLRDRMNALVRDRIGLAATPDAQIIAASVLLSEGLRTNQEIRIALAYFKHKKLKLPQNEQLIAAAYLAYLYTGETDGNTALLPEPTEPPDEDASGAPVATGTPRPPSNSTSVQIPPP